jgi:alkanesulfonate monooxygenase SsuD/methylene tetrahydromethanopterin reductase-like flavin-dependent oxidoreductase (luciferase family)
LKIYWFERTEDFDFKKLSEELESVGFNGILFPTTASDSFTHIARNIDPTKKIKYMVAIRPYTISPQYISKIKRSMDRISINRIIINFVTGHVYDEEKNLGGIVGDINDASSIVERSNYLIKYLSELNKIKYELPDFYISTSNEFVFDAAKENKILMPYAWYKINRFDLNAKKTMIHVSPIIRETEEEIKNIDKSDWPQDTEFFTKDEFKRFFYKLQDKDFDGILISNSLSKLETENILKTIQEIKEESVR